MNELVTIKNNQIFVVHRRLAEISLKAERHGQGGYNRLTQLEQRDLYHCLKVNAKLVRELDELKNLSYVAHQAGDLEWEREICQQIDQLESRCI